MALVRSITAGDFTSTAGMRPVDAALGLALATGNGDKEAVEVFLHASEPADLAVAGAQVIWRMAAALGRLVEPRRSAPQMIHVFAQALRERGDEFGGAPGGAS